MHLRDNPPVDHGTAWYSTLASHDRQSIDGIAPRQPALGETRIRLFVAQSLVVEDKRADDAENEADERDGRRAEIPAPPTVNTTDRKFFAMTSAP